jgi:hypothetical protein
VHAYFIPLLVREMGIAARISKEILMGRKTKARRFEPRYGVSTAALEVEAEYLGHEVNDWSVLAPADVVAKRMECRTNCEQDWKHLNLLLESLPERDQRVLQMMLFRDFYLLLELYLTYMRSAHPETMTASIAPKTPKLAPSEFTEWLFNP